MLNITTFTFFLASLFSTVYAQNKKIDTTAMYGDVGYHVTCNNKKEDDNGVTISPKGFKNTVRDAAFPIRGRLTKIIVDDFNDDGFPDLLLCIYNWQNHEKGSIYGISSKENASMLPVSFPDIYSDPKNREGYKGQDEFTVTVGSLLRSFPIFKPTDTDKPTGGIRVMQYKIVHSTEHSDALVFKLLRSYEK